MADAQKPNDKDAAPGKPGAAPRLPFAYGRKTRQNKSYGLEQQYGQKPGSYKATYG